ncbi:MAG: diaminopimelate decarboxylase [Gammaproteobacteria bacterium]
MHGFHYAGGQLHVEGVSLADIAGTFGTPVYVYSRAAVEEQWRAYDAAFGTRPHLICYAVKANGNLAVLNLLSRLGSGFDIVSGGELQRVLLAGGDPARVVFSGVGKTREEMRSALEAGIKCFNVESIDELYQLDAVAAETGTVAPVSLRVNPDVDPDTHPYIATGLRESKFGIDIDAARDVYREAASSLQHVDIAGIDCHIGSQITSLDPYRDAVARVMELVQDLETAGICLRHIDLGGGLGIEYRDEQPPAPQAMVEAICDVVPDNDVELLLEPGRSIVGNAGVLLTRVLYLKENGSKRFAIVDAAMNDLIRPALYDAWQNILPLEEKPAGEARRYDIVGPVCETGDFLGLDRTLTLKQGDGLAVCSAGAYGFCMSSNYNARPRAAEILVSGGDVHEIRRREAPEDLWRGETIPPLETRNE